MQAVYIVHKRDQTWLTTWSRKSMARCSCALPAQNCRNSSLPMGSFWQILSYVRCTVCREYTESQSNKLKCDAWLIQWSLGKRAVEKHTKNSIRHSISKLMTRILAYARFLDAQIWCDAETSTVPSISYFCL